MTKCVAPTTFPRLVLVLLDHEPLDFFEYHLLTFAAVGHSTVSTPNANGEGSVDPWAPRNNFRRQLGLYVNPSFVYLISGSPHRSVWRTPSATGRSPLVSLPHGTRKEETPYTDGRFDALASCLIESFAHERVVWSVGCRRWKPMTPWLRAWWWAVRSMVKCFSLRVHATDPYRMVSKSPRPPACAISDYSGQSSYHYNTGVCTLFLSTTHKYTNLLE